VDDLQQELERGKQAEDFLKYTQEHPYFNGLIERVGLQYAQSILSLDPNEPDVFVRLRCRMQGAAEVIDAIHGDIYLGAEAFKKLTGVTEEPKGLL
jgi:hypothetical protein